ALIAVEQTVADDTGTAEVSFDTVVGNMAVELGIEHLTDAKWQRYLNAAPPVSAVPESTEGVVGEWIDVGPMEHRGSTFEDTGRRRAGVDGGDRRRMDRCRADGAPGIDV